jgi:acetyl esterase
LAINKAMLMALKALSFPDINLKKNYNLVRKVVNITHPHYLKPFYKAWNHKVHYDGYDIPVRIFSASGDYWHPVLLFFHGGGWVTGNIESYNNVCANMAKLTGNTVVSVEYRLAPEYRYPTAPEDCYHVAREIFLNSERLFRIKPEEITLIGDSAGGNLAAVVSLMARDRKEFFPTRQILIYPSTNNDFSENSVYASIVENGSDYLLTAKKLRDYMELYRSDEKDINDPYFAPILSKDLSKQPKTLIITAEFDPLRDEGEAYGKKLEEHGNEVKIHRLQDAFHGFFSLSPKFELVQNCYKYINDFLSEGNGLNEE